jgi:uncharacterized protein
MIDIAGWLFGAVILLGAAGVVVLFQHRFIYFPWRYATVQLEDARTAGVEEVKFRTSQGNQTAFFWLNETSDKAPQNVWLLFGGNGDVALSWIPLIRDSPDPDSGYLLIDYPGYGICEGKPNPETILENSEGALRTLRQEKAWKRDGVTLCVLGHSLGGAAALQFAAKNPVHKILLISTFTTMDDMVRAQIRIPLGFFLRHRFDNIASLKTILSQKRIPEICIFHGQADEIVPPKMGRALSQLDPVRIKFCEISGARHNDIFQTPLAPGLQSAFFDSIIQD